MTRLEFEVANQMSARTEENIERAGVRVFGHIVLSQGLHTMVRFEMNHLRDSPEEYDAVLQDLAVAPALPPADVIVGVPNGARHDVDAMEKKGYLGGVAIAKIVKAGDRFVFETPSDRGLVQDARSVRIYEDVLTTGLQAAMAARLMHSAGIEPTIHVQAIVQRGEISDAFASLATYHALLTAPTPTYPPEQCPYEHQTT